MQDCAKCKGAEAAQKQAPPPKTYLGKIQGVFAKSQEGKLWEKPRIQTAPRMLVLHFKRHDVVPPSHSQDQHRVRKVDAAVKVDLVSSPPFPGYIKCRNSPNQCSSLCRTCHL